MSAGGLGDASSASPHLKENLGDLRPDDGPLTTITDASGRAVFRQLPRTNVTFVATKQGFAEGYAFREQGTIRLTPSATLSGRLTGPDGQPLSHVKVVLFPTFLWAFEYTLTDADGRFKIEDLKARGWDMSAWGSQTQTGNGTYKLWIESDRFAIDTRTITLEPNTREAVDLQAEVAGVIRVRVTEAGTDKPVGDVRIWGFDKTTGGSGRFNAYTDEKGQATFYSTPATIWLGIAGPPDGYFLDGDRGESPSMSQQFEFAGGTEDIRLVMPRLTGPLIAVSGVCTRPDGSPATGAGVSAVAGRFLTSNSSSFLPMRRADSTGRFTFETVPAGRTIQLYAETEDRKFAGTATVRTPDTADPKFGITLILRPAVPVDLSVKNDAGKPLPSRKFLISPLVANADFPFLGRDAESNAEGVIKLDGIVPGLSYRVQAKDSEPVRRGVMAKAGGRPTLYDEVMVLAPKAGD